MSDDLNWRYERMVGELGDNQYSTIIIVVLGFLDYCGEDGFIVPQLSFQCKNDFGATFIMKIFGFIDFGLLLKYLKSCIYRCLPVI
ncbi:hypothetical protein Hanom_Chr15g01378831 [Helianthus anomalus]